MSELKIGKSTFNPQAVSAVASSRAAETVRAMRKNGADDVLVKVGDGLFLASGRGMAVGGIKAGTAVTLDGKAGQVVAVDTELNTFREGTRHWAGGLVALSAPLAGLIVGLAQRNVGSGLMVAALTQITLPLGALINGAIGVNAAKREIRLNQVKTD